jgi:hypothetical protein
VAKDVGAQECLTVRTLTLVRLLIIRASGVLMVSLAVLTARATIVTMTESAVNTAFFSFLFFSSFFI